LSNAPFPVALFDIITLKWLLPLPWRRAFAAGVVEEATQHQAREDI
jgi:hypothetical protein